MTELYAHLHAQSAWVFVLTMLLIIVLDITRQIRKERT